MSSTGANSSDNETDKSKQKENDAKETPKNIAAKDVKFVGVGLNVTAILGLQGFSDKGQYFEYEFKGKGTFLNYESGPLHVRLAAGLSSAAKLEDGTIDTKFLGCGTKVGKRFGFTLFDSEFSIDTLSILGKGWLWCKP